MEKGVPWRSWTLDPRAHSNYAPAYVRLRSLGTTSSTKLVGEVYNGSTSSESQGFDPLVVPTLVDRQERRVVVDSKAICEYVDQVVPKVCLIPPEHAVLIRKHLALVDETPHQGILYGLHLADVVAERKDPLVVAFAGVISNAQAGQLKSLQARLAEDLAPELRKLYEAKKKKTELAKSAVGKLSGLKETYRAMLAKVDAMLLELEADLRKTGGPYVCGTTCTMADLVWHCSLLRLYELGFEDHYAQEKLPRVHEYAHRILRRDTFARATYLWPYKPVTRNLKLLMSEQMPLQAFFLNLMSKILLGPLHMHSSPGVDADVTDGINADDLADGVPESFDHLCKQMKDYNMDADLKPHGSRILVDSKFVVNSEYVNPLVPLNMQRLKLALRHDVPIRFRQFQSTTSDYKVAARFQKREDHPGFLWVIDIPENHFGARNIQDVSSRSNESETLFPPYSMFQVVEVSNQRCHLKALPWVWEEYEPRSAQGEPFDLDDEPITGCVRCCV
ncbi:2 [Durusdinium trenchii]|uniref:NAD(P)(+)--arginine ADP-ribosyltransferase n=1 Tax=Durusdinium trenchii TaxID=1381693 RepID=A0ABP0JX53_9DINO